MVMKNNIADLGTCEQGEGRRAKSNVLGVGIGALDIGYEVGVNSRAALWWRVMLLCRVLFCCVVGAAVLELSVIVIGNASGIFSLRRTSNLSFQR